MAIYKNQILSKEDIFGRLIAAAIECPELFGNRLPKVRKLGEGFELKKQEHKAKMLQALKRCRLSIMVTEVFGMDFAREEQREKFIDMAMGSPEWLGKHLPRIRKLAEDYQCMKQDFMKKMWIKILLYFVAKEGPEELFNILSTIELKLVATSPGILSRFTQNCKVKGKKVKSTANPSTSLKPLDDGQWEVSDAIWKIIRDIPQEPHREQSIEEKEHRARIEEIALQRIRGLVATRGWSTKETPRGFSTFRIMFDEDAKAAKRSPKHELARAYDYTGTRHVKRVLSEGLEKQRKRQEESEKHRRAIGISNGRKKSAVRTRCLTCPPKF